MNCATEPSNLAVIYGSQAVFKCSSDYMIGSTGRSLWTFYSLEESNKEIQIFNGHNVRYPYNGSFWLNSSSRGQYDLMKNVATLEDAGTYQCSRSLDTKFHAELIVLGELTILSISVHFNGSHVQIILTCVTLPYHGTTAMFSFVW